MTEGVQSFLSQLFLSMRNELIELGHDPFMMVNLSLCGKSIPDTVADKAQNDIIIFNISDHSLDKFHCDKSQILFVASFQGMEHLIKIPFVALSQLFCREYKVQVLFNHSERFAQIYSQGQTRTLHSNEKIEDIAPYKGATLLSSFKAWYEKETFKRKGRRPFPHFTRVDYPLDSDYSDD